MQWHAADFVPGHSGGSAPDLHGIPFFHPIMGPYCSFVSTGFKDKCQVCNAAARDDLEAMTRSSCNPVKATLFRPAPIPAKHHPGQPVCAIGIEFLFFAENLTLTGSLGAAIVLFSIYIASRK